MNLSTENDRIKSTEYKIYGHQHENNNTCQSELDVKRRVFASDDLKIRSSRIFWKFKRSLCLLFTFRFSLNSSKAVVRTMWTHQVLLHLSQFFYICFFIQNFFRDLNTSKLHLLITSFRLKAFPKYIIYLIYQLNTVT